MDKPLAGRIAVVTGASRGIGRAAALAFAEAGAHVVALARTQGALEELDDAIRARGGEPATLVPLDLTDFAALDRLGAALHERWRRLDVLLGNAGVLGDLTPLSHLDPCTRSAPPSTMGSSRIGISSVWARLIATSRAWYRGIWSCL